MDAGGLEVDFLWREHRLIVETDGYRYHRGRVAFENDRSRDLRLRELGFDVLRLSDTQLQKDPYATATAVRRMLRRPPRGSFVAHRPTKEPRSG